MPTSFLDRYYADVKKHVGDPAVSKRLTNTVLYGMLLPIETALWERLQRASGQESMLGYAEATVTLEDGKHEYRLPGNFRQFLGFEYRENGDREVVTATMNSIPYYSSDIGVVIKSQSRGMEVRPIPQLSTTRDWTLKYLRGPIEHFNVTTTDNLTFDLANGTFSVAIDPGQTPDNGNMHTIGDYYVGQTIRIYDESQYMYPNYAVVESQSYDLTDGLKLTLANGWTTNPADTPATTFSGAKLETVPLLPEGYDSIYAFDAAIRILSERGGNSVRRKELMEERAELFSACQSYVLSNVADRGPTRGTYIDVSEEPDSGYESGYDFL